MTTSADPPSDLPGTNARSIDQAALYRHRIAGEFAKANFGADRPIRGLTSTRDDAAAWLTTGWSPPHHAWLYAVGEPETATRLARRLARDAGDVVGATVERAIVSALPPALRPDGDPWDWWSTVQSPPDQRGEEHVVFSAAEDGETTEAIQTLLDIASPDHWAPPGHPTVVRWALLRDAASGALIACASETRQGNNVPHLASVATHPDHRGHGMARTVVAALTRRLFDEGATTVTLGMHADNDAARRVYTALGYTVKYRWLSGRLTE